MYSRYSSNALLLAYHILSAQGAVIDQRSQHNAFQLGTFNAKAFSDPTADKPTDNFITLKKSSSQSKSSAYLEQIRRANNPQKRDTTPVSPLISVNGGIEYLTEITFGGSKVDVIVDTGSSDTWLIQDGFQCVDANKQSQPAKTCNFGPAYIGSFGTAQIPDVNFNISYGDGEFVTGVFGTADIGIGGLTVSQQTSALGTYAYWNGDAISSGLLGLAYSALTSEYKGTDPTKDSSSQRNAYDPIFTKMYKDGLSSPMFSMAIERGAGGYLAFGGLPPVNYTGSFAKTAIQLMSTRNGPQYLFYTMTPDALVYSGAPSSQSDVFIVDSGTTLVYGPPKAVAAINKLFSPPATVSQGTYLVDCKAKAPSFGVKIGGQTFQVSPKDMIISDPSGLCISGIQNGGSGPYILGDVFMTNVVVAFDVGAAEMRFAAHVDY